MTRIPVDPDVPIACTASGDELSTRIDQLEHVRARLRSIDRTADGLVLRFRPDADLAAHLQRFVADEKGCCRFWGFRIDDTPVELALRWDGPPDGQPILDELHRWFTSDEPLTALSGLL